MRFKTFHSTSGKAKEYSECVPNSPLISGNYYHVYNRGVEKRDIFLESRDYLRLLEAIDFYRMFPTPMKLSDFRRIANKVKFIKEQSEIVQILCYSLIPNHFHFLLYQVADGGITQFMRKLLDSYTRYFNTKYDRVGPLFQGSFKAKLIQSEEYLLQLSKYIHRNHFELNKAEDNQHYPYSSYGWYLSKEGHQFCSTSLICSYFSERNSRLSYQSFVEESDFSDSVPRDLLIDID